MAGKPKKTPRSTGKKTRTKGGTDPRPGSQAAAQAAQLKKRARFLEAFARLGTVSAACHAARVGRRTHYDWLKADDAYAEAFAEAERINTESLEQEAVARARDGWLEPVYQGGELVGQVRKKSDTLLIFLLKARKPDMYREKFEHSGPGGGPIVTKTEVTFGGRWKPPAAAPTSAGG